MKKFKCPKLGDRVVHKPNGLTGTVTGIIQNSLSGPPERVTTIVIQWDGEGAPTSNMGRGYFERFVEVCENPIQRMKRLYSEDV